MATSIPTERIEIDPERLFGLEYWPPIPAFLVSTSDPAGKTHVSPFSIVTFTSYTAVAEDPETPRIISILIGDYERFEGTFEDSTTYRNIRSTAEFVVNVPTALIVEQLNRAGTPSDDKFGTSKLTPERSKLVNAPSVAECVASFECRLHSIEYHRWLGEIIHGRIVLARIDPNYERTEAAERPRKYPPLYHHAYDDVNGTYYGLSEPIMDEVAGRQRVE